MKKIAIFNDFQLPIVSIRGGAVQQLTTLLIEQNEIEHKYDFDIYSPYDAEALKISKKYKNTRFFYSKFSKFIRVYTNVCFKLHLPVDLSAIPLSPDVKKKFLKNHYDAVYVSGYIRGVLTIAKVNNGRCPVYCHHHVVTDILNEKSIRGEDIFKSCEKIGFVSDYACNQAKTGIEVYDEKIVCFRNCIDTNKFSSVDAEKARAEIRGTLGIDANDIVIAFVGRFVSNKGVLQLIKAFKRINAEFPNAKLLLIGGATYSSDAKTPYVKECIELAKTIESQVIMTGYINNDELPKYLAAADIGAVPSVYEEACGLTSIEMMASGLPVLTTNAAGLAEYVPDACELISKWEVGMAADDIVDGLAQNIKTLCDDPQLREKMGACAKEKSLAYDKSKYLRFFGEFIGD